MERADDELMAAVAGGDAAAFDILVRRHRAWICSLLRGYTPDIHRVEDLAQEVFCRILRAAPSYAADGRFVPWVRRIAENVGRTERLRRPTIDWVPIDSACDVAADPAGDPLRILLDAAIAQEIRAALEALPGDQRAAVAMRYFAGMSNQEIAAEQRCPEGTVKSRIHHALRRIRAALTHGQAATAQNRAQAADSRDD